MIARVSLCYFLVFVIICALSRSVLNESTSGAAASEVVMATVKRLTTEAELLCGEVADHKDYSKILEALALTKASLYLCSSNAMPAPDHLLEVFDIVSEKRNSLAFEQ